MDRYIQLKLEKKDFDKLIRDKFKLEVDAGKIIKWERYMMMLFARANGN